MQTIAIDGESLTLADVRAAGERRARFTLADGARRKMQRSRDLVDRMVASGETVYGVTTGFGVFADVTISHQNSLALQYNLIVSHCAGVGEPYTAEVARAMMLLRANALSKGYSGIRPEVVDRLLDLLARDFVPVIPSQGSAGASGDLAPLSHLAGTMIGVGEVWLEGRRMSAHDALGRLRIEPVQFLAKEGLAMVNGTQAITAVGGLALERALMLASVADVFAAFTLDVLLGTDEAFDPRIHDIRPHPGQIEVARRLRELLRDSGLRESHRDCEKVQDAYSLRCAPQVHGAVRDALEFVADKFAIEINSATDNPLVFADGGTVLSGGNFHGAPVALACDVGAIAATDLASISERRIERLVNPDLSGDLPAFLVREGGLNSGFMMAQVTAASLVSECKAISHPASVDTIPTSAGKEDHVSMGPTAAWKFARIVENLASVLAIEGLCAAQALDLRRSLRSSPALEKVHALIRSKVEPWITDRYLHADLTSMKSLLPEIHALTENV